MIVQTAHIMRSEKMTTHRQVAASYAEDVKRLERLLHSREQRIRELEEYETQIEALKIGLGVETYEKMVEKIDSFRDALRPFADIIKKIEAVKPTPVQYKQDWPVPVPVWHLHKARELLNK